MYSIYFGGASPCGTAQTVAARWRKLMRHPERSVMPDLTAIQERFDAIAAAEALENLIEGVESKVYELQQEQPKLHQLGFDDRKSEH